LPWSEKCENIIDLLRKDFRSEIIRFRVRRSKNYEAYTAYMLNNFCKAVAEIRKLQQNNLCAVGLIHYFASRVNHGNYFTSFSISSISFLTSLSASSRSFLSCLIIFSSSTVSSLLFRVFSSIFICSRISSFNKSNAL
jgi:hypothetical protein